MITFTLLVAFLALFPLRTYQAVWKKRVLDRLAKNHREVWNELGQPTLIMNASWANYLSVRQFLKTKGYRGLDDSELSNACRNLRLFDRLFNITLLVTLILLVAVMWQDAWN